MRQIILDCLVGAAGAGLFTATVSAVIGMNPVNVVLGTWLGRGSLVAGAVLGYVYEAWKHLPAW
ncbi:MAG: hypothetical protein RIQ56_171 [Candidatus Parcubacteria bacterium]